MNTKHSTAQPVTDTRPIARTVRSMRVEAFTLRVLAAGIVIGAVVVAVYFELPALALGGLVAAWPALSAHWLSEGAAATEGDFVEMEELDVFLSPKLLLTYRDGPIQEVGHIHQMLANGMTMRPGTDGLLYEIVDRTVDALLPGVEGIGNRLDDIHDLVLEDPGNNRSHDIVSLRAHAGRVRARIDSGVASTIIRVPEGVAARIRVENGLGDVRVDRERFPRSGGGYESPGYVDAVDAVDLDVHNGVGSVRIE